MGRITRLFAGLVLLGAPAATLCGEHTTLRAGALIHCTLEEPAFSSETAEIGDPVHCHLGPLTEFGEAVFKRGSYITGRFADFRKPGRLKGKGWLKLDFNRLILANTEIPIAAKVVSASPFPVDAQGRIKGRGHPKRDLVGWLIPPFWPVKLVTLPMRGPRPTLKGELPFTLRLLEDVAIPRE